MPEIYVTHERAVGAPAHLVYSLIADMKNHHSNFLPDCFSPLTVEKGGYGDGTVISFTMRLGGQTTAATSDIAEPEPGRVLTERVRQSGLLTTWTVTPTAAGCTVRLESRWHAGGLGGLLQWLVAPGMLRKVYDEELRLLDAYARSQVPQATPV
jgi:ribosome-associated toxin RatA of RatAB toxin-antitoxin module